MQDTVDNLVGVNGQLQAELDDIRVGQSEGDAMDEADDAEEPEVVVTDMPPPPPRAPVGSLVQIRAKQLVKEWNDPANSWRWYLSAAQPVAAGMTLQRAKALLRDKAEITTKNLYMINDLADIGVCEFVSPGDDRFATDRMPTEHLEIFIGAIVKIASKGVTSSISKARITALEQGLRYGLEILRQHCIECRNLVRIPANSRMLTDLVNLDLNEWGAGVYDAATDFVAVHDSPPAMGAFPGVKVPTWKRLSQFVGAGGLRNSHHQPRSQSNPPASTKGGSKKKNYCYAFQNGTCTRSARHCRWLHEIDHNGPDENGGNRNGGGGRGRGGGGNGGANRNDGNATASSGGGRNYRGGAGSSGGGASQSGNENGGGSSSGGGGGGGPART